uniref:HECT domain-containing protein n=1 Tax=Neolamprologus brichardi TaxID=32507 RepID=A0A3Q4MD59_NEOBR
MKLLKRPGHILAFATGSSKVPAIGFQPAPKITFIHDESKHLPIAHTCLPVNSNVPKHSSKLECSKTPVSFR